MNRCSVKGVFIGKAGVGKSSIIYHYINQKFSPNVKTTIGASFAEIKMDNFKLDVWDTAGQEKYESLTPMYYRNSDYIFLVFDITDVNSIYYCKNKIEHFIKVLPHATIILIGNKSDLNNIYCNNNFSIAQEISSKYNLKLYYTSAKTGLNIKNIFETVKYIKKSNIEAINIEMVNNKKNCCTIN